MTNSSEEGEIFIIGGGVAGIAAAYQIVKQRKADAPHQRLPKITIIDRNQQVAQGTSEAYGGFLTANSYLTVDFPNGHETLTRLTQPYVPDALATPGSIRGWATHPASDAEMRWINTAAQCADQPADAKEKEKILYHRFGLSCIEEWERFFNENPSLAEASSFHFSDGSKPGEGVLKIFEPPVDQEHLHAEIGFLKEVGGRAAHARTVTAKEAATYCPAVQDAYGRDAHYVVQHGGNVNGQAFCRQMVDYLKREGCPLEFLGGQQVSAIHYGSNSEAIQSIELQDVHSGKKRSLGNYTDKFVFAPGPDAGIWQKIGFGSSPIMGVAGTTLTVPVPKHLTGMVLKNPIKLVDAYGAPVMIPLKGDDGQLYIRVGGYTAFSGEQSTKTTDAFAEDFLRRQFNLLKKLYPTLATHFLTHELHGDIDNLPRYPGSWTGRRPVTPDNHAIVDHIATPRKQPCPNGFILTGHGAAGLLAMGTSNILAQLLAGKDRHKISVPGLSEDESAQLLDMTELSRFQHFRPPLSKGVEK